MFLLALDDFYRSYLKDTILEENNAIDVVHLHAIIASARSWYKQTTSNCLPEALLVFKDQDIVAKSHGFVNFPLMLLDFEKKLSDSKSNSQPDKTTPVKMKTSAMKFPFSILTVVKQDEICVPSSLSSLSYNMDWTFLCLIEAVQMQCLIQKSRLPIAFCLIQSIIAK
jgi:hypothetical protein